MQIASAQAEAYHSNRTLLWGPIEALPPLLAGARCGAEGGARGGGSAKGGAASGGEGGLVGGDCYFKPLGTCEWSRHVYREEAERFLTTPQGDELALASSPSVFPSRFSR